MEDSIEEHRELILEDIYATGLEDWLQRLVQRRIHPILVFGTTYSGKTTMLQSLLYYARNSPNSRIDVSYGEPVFPENNAIWADRINEGRNFFELGVPAFGNRKLSGSTQKDFPFFIPVDIVVNDERLKVAFLEGNGEWYQRKRTIDANSSIFEDFRAEVSAIVTKFKAPISVIFVAPAAVVSMEAQNITDEGLTNCIEQYKKRRNGERDNLLLLFSKWDMLCDPSDREGGFSDINADGLIKKVEGRRFLWNKFASLALPITASKTLMPYSASWIKGEKFEPYDQKYQVVFDKYNRTLWNWLYGNAMAAKSDSASPARAVLYDDVNVKRGAASRFYLALTSTLLWVGRRRAGEE